MNAWARHHWYSLARSFARLAASPVSSFCNVMAIGMALALPLLGYAALQNLRALAPRVQGQSQVTVFVAPGTAPADAEAIERRLRADSAVKDVRFVSRDAALAALKRSPGLADLVAVMRDNPLPDAYVATLSSSDPEAGERLAGTARSLRHVAQAQADSLWMRRLDAMLGIGRAVVLLIGAFLALALVAATFNTIRLQILTEREEIEVSKLVGATDAYVRRPFLYWGALLGALGGAAALGMTAAALAWLGRDVARVAELYGSRFSLQSLAPGDALFFLLLAGALGWSGAALSVSKHLREVRPS
jgi:cell division transport system permease protein